MKRRQTLSGIKKIIRENKRHLSKKYKVNEIGLFGSRVRENESRSSDLDILVDFRDVISLFDFVALERELSQLTGHKVDLVMKSSLKPVIGSCILREVVYI